VSWFNRKQKSVALSSAEVEYMATSQANCEAPIVSSLASQVVGGIVWCAVEAYFDLL
jgi:hypothetical protein